MINKISYKILEILRSYIEPEYMMDVAVKYSVLGYVESMDNSYIEKILRSLDIKEELKNTFNLIENENEQLQGVFQWLRYDYEIPNEGLYKLVSAINEINVEQDEWKAILDDINSKIYESTFKYLGESSTPKYLNELGIGLLDPGKGSLYDGTCGEGGSLIEGANYAKLNGESLKIYGQEINNRAWAICKARLFINNIIDSEVKLGNTLTQPLFKEEGKLKIFDNIMMQIPLGMIWKDEKKYIENDEYNRFIFGKPPVSNGEWLFVSHIIKSLNKKGKAVAITSPGTLFRGASEEEIRRNIINLDCIEAVISLAGVLTITSMPINMLIINMDKEQSLKNKILFINAESMYEIKNRNQKVLSKEHIDKIIDIYRNKKEIEEISAIVDIKELEGSNLLPSKNVLKTEVVNEEFGAIKFDKEKLNNLNKCKTLGQIGKFYRGINVIGSKVEQNEHGEYKIINLSDVKDGQIDIDSLTKYSLKDNARVESYTVSEGDILISSRGSNTKICVVPKHSETILISQNFIGFRLSGEDNPQYIKEFLESPLGQYLISSKQTGTNMVTLNTKDLVNIPIVLLNQKQQFKIINKYNDEYKSIKDEIEVLNNKLKDIRLDLYNDMGIRSIFKIL